MKVISYTLMFLLAFPEFASAGAYKGGKIEAKHIFGFTYEIKITTYTSPLSAGGDRPTLDSVHLGDGSTEQFVRSTHIILPNDVSFNVYVKQHTYSGPGVFVIHFIEERVFDINNIPNSGNTPFEVETKLVINTLSCPASTPIFTAPPIFNTMSGKKIALSLSAYDLDKDSLSYEIVACHWDANLPINGYFFPPGISLDQYTGEFNWAVDTLSSITTYAFAVKVHKWRNGIDFGFGMEDFTVTVAPSSDTLFDFIHSSVIPVDSNGSFVSSILPLLPFNLHLEYYDSSVTPQPVLLYSEIDSSQITLTNPSSSTESIDFSWTPSQANVRNTPYTLVFRGEPGETDLTYLIYVTGIDSNQCNSTIGISEISSGEDNIHVYPNPVHDLLQIECDFKIHSQTDYSLTDMLGQILSETKTNDNFLTIQVNNLSSGIYFLKIENAGDVFIRKINVY